MSRLYIVTDSTDPKVERLIDAPNPAQAIRHVASRFKAAPAGPRDVERLIRGGTRTETAGEEPEPTVIDLDKPAA